jgi:hypothetical protein
MSNNDNYNNNAFSSDQQPGNAQVKFPVTFKHHNFRKREARPTPWSCAAEFDYVGRCFAQATCLFSDSSPWNDENEVNVNHQSPVDGRQPLGELQYAIQRVCLWKIRAENGHLPHSVEITCSLAQILLEDATLHAVTKNQSSSEAFQLLMHQNSIKLSYATAIIRGVNGIADSLQRNRAKIGASVSSLCSQIGLPLWIVDLRHDSAHNDLPSLVSLRLAAQTLVGFFLQHYWTVVEDFRMNLRAQAESLLSECKSSCKELDRLKCNDWEESSNTIHQRGKEQGDDDTMIAEEAEAQEEYDYGTYSVLMESNTKKKKQKTIKSRTSSSSERMKLRDRMHGRTPRQCLQDYIEKIPIDMGMEMLLQYLFYGGISDAPDGRGILIPGSPATFPETINSARKMRERYSVILIYITEHWPGFLHAAMKTITHLIILLEGNHNVRDVSVDSLHDGSCDFGSSRKLFFLKHWFIYLLSNEFFCFLQWIEVSWKGSKNIRERPREKWSEDLLLFLESFAPSDALKKARIPLYSIYKRFISDGGGPVSHELAVLLETVLGEDCNLNASKMDSNSSECPSTLNSWTSCTNWEPCAIGTLPGHVEHFL